MKDPKEYISSHFYTKQTELGEQLLGMILEIQEDSFKEGLKAGVNGLSNNKELLTKLLKNLK